MEREREIRRRKNVMLQLQESSALLNVKEFAVRRNEAKAQLDQEKSNMKDGEQQLVILEKEYEAKKKDYDTVMKELEGANLVSWDKGNNTKIREESND
jgi:deoxycytidine triphosphate deaminase